MSYFLLRLMPPRATFGQDMTETESKVMRDHAAYWNGLVETGRALIFGAVADPKGAWGIGIVQVEDEDTARMLAANDPAVGSEVRAVYEISPMPRVIVRKRDQTP